MYFNLHIVDIDEHVNGINLFYKKKKEGIVDYKREELWL